MVGRGAWVYRGSYCQPTPIKVPAQHLEILLPSQSCLLSPTPPSHLPRYSFLMKIFLLMMQFLTLCEKITFCVPLNQSQENIESGIMCWCTFCTEAAIKRPQALLTLFNNCNICESSKKTPSPLASVY